MCASGIVVLVSLCCISVHDCSGLMLQAGLVLQAVHTLFSALCILVDCSQSSDTHFQAGPTVLGIDIRLMQGKCSCCKAKRSNADKTHAKRVLDDEQPMCYSRFRVEVVKKQSSRKASPERGGEKGLLQQGLHEMALKKGPLKASR